MVEDNKQTEGTSIQSDGDGLALISVVRRLAWPLLVTYALLPVAFLVPAVDSTREPYFDLTSGFAIASYWVAESGGGFGAQGVGVADAKEELSINVPIQCGGVPVRPGDFIVADLMGVTVVALEHAEEVIEKAREQAEREEETRKWVAQGKTVEDLLNEFGRI